MNVFKRLMKLYEAFVILGIDSNIAASSATKSLTGL